MVPAIPPHIASSATFWSWKMMSLFGGEVSLLDFFGLEWKQENTYPSLVQVVPVIAAGLTVVLARKAKTSK